MKTKTVNSQPKTSKKETFLDKVFSLFKKENKPVTSAKILINGKLLVFIVCSIISMAINLVFITNLTKSSYEIGTILSIPAAILLGLMSIGLDLSKCLHAVQVNTLNELYRKVKKYEWSKSINKVAKKWFFMYVLYVILSIITSVSLSSISIGAGITRNANTLKQIDEFIVQGETYSNVDSTSKNIQMQSLITKATDTSEQDAINFAKKAMIDLRPAIEAYKEERTSFENQKYLVSSRQEMEWNGTMIVPNTYWDQKNIELNNKLTNAGYPKCTGSQLKNLNIAQVELTIKENNFNNSKTVSSEEATKKLDELSNTTMDEALGWIETLNNVGLVNPKTGEIVVFETNKEKSTKVLISAALTRLKSLRVDIENDSGDIGSSSKIFMQLGSAIEGNKVNNSTDLKDVISDTKSDNGSFGYTEIMMMGMLLFLSLLCEVAINQFSPKTNISRKMMSQFSEYFPPEFNIDDFMITVYIEQFKYGTMTQAQFDNKIKKAIEMSQITKENLIEKYTQNKTNLEKKVNDNGYSKEIEEQIITINNNIENLKQQISDLSNLNKNVEVDVESSKEEETQVINSDINNPEIDKLISDIEGMIK